MTNWDNTTNTIGQTQDESTMLMNGIATYNNSTSDKWQAAAQDMSSFDVLVCVFYISFEFLTTNYFTLLRLTMTTRQTHWMNFTGRLDDDDEWHRHTQRVTSDEQQPGTHHCLMYWYVFFQVSFHFFTNHVTLLLKSTVILRLLGSKDDTTNTPDKHFSFTIRNSS